MQPDNIIFWIDLNLPPQMASWLWEDFKVTAKSFKELGFEIKGDAEIFRLAAKELNTIIITTKDIDFVSLQNDIGAPPKILYLNIGNISNKQLKQLITNNFAEVLRLFIETNNSLVEISF
jgi:predicted nuclease of predicted toxin-antitoxin system